MNYKIECEGIVSYERTRREAMTKGIRMLESSKTANTFTIKVLRYIHRRDVKDED